MAPKLGVNQQQLLQLGQLVAGIVQHQAKPGVKPGQQPGTWACAYCLEGGSNWAHRQTCFKCHRDRRSGVLVTPVPGAAQPGSKGSRSQPRAKSAAPALKTPPPAVSAKPSAAEPEEEEDPVAQELEDARAYHGWVKQQKARVRERELPAAEERLAKAEAADKQRKPPSERLQSALSRVAYRQRLATAAEEAEQAAQEALQAAKKEATAAQQKLTEAQQELAVAQAAHTAWSREGKTGEGEEAGSYLGGEITPDQQQALEELSTKYIGTEVGTLLLRVFLKAVLQPGNGPPPLPPQLPLPGRLRRVRGAGTGETPRQYAKAKGAQGAGTGET